MHCGVEVTESSTNKQHHISQDKKASLAEEDGSAYEDEQGPQRKHMHRFLKGFILFMKNVGLIPPQKHGEPAPPQYAVGVQCYKAVQQQGAQRTLHFPEFKQVIHQFLQKGPDLLELERKNKREEIRELELKIARMLPNCNDPVADVKAVFRQLFDTIFEAFMAKETGVHRPRPLWHHIGICCSAAALY
jgi:hypothetical protein